MGSSFGVDHVRSKHAAGPVIQADLNTPKLFHCCGHGLQMTKSLQFSWHHPVVLPPGRGKFR